ncbi:hypothetical protein NP493_873g01026 [Ridgeia piscesae]|uniref:Centrosome and spindle pole-associated protein 1 C-terminal domain-containing protein n=1 Tax=Ridgeia piscesae TaxID=27915 RepID=A0AAD9NKJ5_RIDPI|nr:hypothetical protein NP493_873g01026 [Ridgeia piscesae]
MSYQAELLKQIEEQKNKKLKQKQDEQRYNMKMEEQLKIYDPFGKGGGGAPVRDADGNLVTNRKQAAAARATEQYTEAAVTGEMANLRMMHLDNEEKWRDPSKFTGIQPVTPRAQVAPPVLSVTSHQQAALPSPVAEGGPPQEQQYARGSSLMRILGDGMTEVQKSAQQKYQDDLRKQIEDKKRKQEEEKRQQQLEDERLMQKIEEENRKMQQQLEDEKRKERQKQEEAQRQQEQLKKAQEDRRKEVERARKEAEEKRHEEMRKKQEEEQQRRKEEEEITQPVSPPIRSKTQPLSPGAQTTDRLSQPPPPSPPIPTLAPVQPPPSPPIPTLRAKEEREASPPVPALLAKDSAAEMMDERPISPPLPANRSKTNPEKMVSDDQLGRKSPPVPARRSSSREARPPSAEVLNQLAAMRKQLLHERRRIEGDLNKPQDEPEVYDPRIYQSRPASRKNVDVFEVARTGEPVSHRRQGDVTSSNLREFQHLRNKEDTESRQNLRSMFPDEPMTSDAVETQQRLLLTEQEETLKKMAKRKSLMKRLDPHDLGLLREGSIISANMLESDSAFISVPNGRQSSVNSGRTERSRHPPTPSSGQRRRRQVETPDSIYTNPMGSVRSLDPESINSKNEERLRRLKALTGDDISVADPEDVLDRFMAKQQYKR